jgi:hypothetical protein
MAEQTKPVVCSALAPVPAGQRRYRVRGLLDSKRLAVLYVLALSEDEAKAAYVEELNLHDQVERLTFMVGLTPN